MSDEFSSTSPERPLTGEIQATGAEIVGGLRARARAELHPADSGIPLLQHNTKYLPPQDDARLANERSRRDVATRIAFHLERNEFELAREFLTSFTFLAARLAHSGTAGLLSDFQRAAAFSPMHAYADLRLVHDTLALIEPILRVAPSQLPEQVLARLPPNRTERTDRLRDIARKYRRTGPWLRPLHASFTGPGDGLRRVLERHRGLPSALAFSHDGSFLVSADSEELLVWDLSTYEPCARLRGHKEEVTGLAMTHDGRLIVAAVRAPFLYCWNLDEGGEAVRLTGHTGAVLALLGLPDGQVLSADSKGLLLRWALARKQADMLGSLSGSVHSLAMFPGGRQCVTASGPLLSGPAFLTVWEWQRGEVLDTIRWDQGSLTQVTVSGDGQYVLAASNQALLCWELPGWIGPHELGRHSWRISALTSSADGRWAVSADTGGNLQVWDLKEKTGPLILRGHRLMIGGAAISPKGLLATTGFDQTVRVWDFPPLSERGQQAAHRDAITRLVTWSRGGQQFVLSASQDHTLAIIDLDGMTERHRLRGHTHWVSGVAIAAERGWAVSVSWDGTLAVWDLQTGQRLRQMTGPEPHFQDVVVNAAGTCAVTAPYEGKIRVWNLAAGQEIASCDPGVGKVNRLAMTPNGSHLLVGGQGLAYLRLSAAGLTPLGMLLTNDPSGSQTHNADTVQAITLFPNGSRCLAATASGRLHLCDLADRRLVCTWRDSPSGVPDVAISACGRMAATAGGLPSGSSDDTLRLWDSDTGTVLARFIGDCPFRCCAFSEGGESLIAGDSWGRIHEFALDGLG